MKKDRIIFWAATGFIFLFEAAMPALTSHTEPAIEGIRHLGLPDYFRVLLTYFKIIGGLLLILPIIPPCFKEWAYAGFGFGFIKAWRGGTFRPSILCGKRVGIPVRNHF
jgi:hypothetical protein